MFSTQSIEEPADPKHLISIFDMIDAENFLMFSSDYPHWDNDMPTEILKRLNPEARRKIFHGNAKALYNIYNGGFAMAIHYIAGTDEIPEGQSKIVQVEGRSIGVYRIDGEYYALQTVARMKAPSCARG